MSLYGFLARQHNSDTCFIQQISTARPVRAMKGGPAGWS